ncbi:hypothetical protein MHU86_7541 [Fragilaria crotonensis]|nr:hypothetical protein MHU86_7541 [Fragilaria crotonensis]
MRKLWEEWMISTGLHQGKIDPPTRKHIAEWCSVSSQDLPAQMVRNSWRHGMYSYYPVPPVQEEEHTTDDEVNDFVGNQQNDNPEDDEGGDEYDGSDDDETLRNHSSLFFLAKKTTIHTTSRGRNNNMLPTRKSAVLDTKMTLYSSRVATMIMGAVMMTRTLAATMTMRR